MSQVKMDYSKIATVLENFGQQPSSESKFGMSRLNFIAAVTIYAIVCSLNERTL